VVKGAFLSQARGVLDDFLLEIKKPERHTEGEQE
jgi:hypothetical protein